MNDSAKRNMETVARLWNEAQEKAGPFIKEGKAPPAELLDMIMVCHEAMAARDLSGRRYYEIAYEWSFELDRLRRIEAAAKSSIRDDRHYDDFGIQRGGVSWIGGTSDALAEALRPLPPFVGFDEPQRTSQTEVETGE